MTRRYVGGLYRYRTCYGCSRGFGFLAMTSSAASQHNRGVRAW